MSPSEFDLRAALRDGEGDDAEVKVERVIAAGRARRARRTRLLSAGAAAVLVVGVGVGIAEWGPSLGSSSKSTGTANGADVPAHGAQLGELQNGPADARAPVPAAGGQSSGGASAGSSGGSGSVGRTDVAENVACPADAPRYVLPGGGSPGQFGSSGPLFAKSVTSVVVCAYGSPEGTLSTTSGATPARLVLTGAQAGALVDSVENASTSKAVRPCPQTSAGRSPQLLALIGVTADGTTLTPVTAMLTDPPCNVTVSNGTAVRYQWQPPTSLLNTLLALAPTR